MALSVTYLSAESMPAILLTSDQGFTRLELTDYKDPSGQSRTYVRSLQSGRFLDAAEEDRLVSAEFFYHVREASPMEAATDSLLHFDAAAEYVWHGWDSDSPVKRNLNARILKLGLLGLTAIAYRNASTRAADLAENSILPSRSDQRSFATSRNLYYATTAITTGTYAWLAFRAYSSFGQNAQGESLRIPERVEVPFSSPGAGGSPASMNPGAEYGLSMTFAFDPVSMECSSTAGRWR